MRFLPAAAVLLTLGLLNVPSSAQTPDTAAPAPAATPATSAPATAPAADNSWMEYRDPYAGEQNDLANPHRSAEEITAWTEAALTDSMSFSPKTFAEHLGEVKKYFTQQGWYEYAAYMKESKLVSMIRDQNYNVTTILNGDAAVVNSASSGGVYHWLVTAPLIISLVYDDPAADPAPVPGGTYRAVIQLGRTSTGGDENGLAIESWKVESVGR